MMADEVEDYIDSEVIMAPLHPSTRRKRFLIFKLNPELMQGQRGLELTFNPFFVIM